MKGYFPVPWCSALNYVAGTLSYAYSVLRNNFLRCHYISQEQMQMKGSTDNKPEEFLSVWDSRPHSGVRVAICFSWVSSEYVLKAWTQLSRKSERTAGKLLFFLQVTSGFDVLQIHLYDLCPGWQKSNLMFSTRSVIAFQSRACYILMVQVFVQVQQQKHWYVLG